MRTAAIAPRASIAPLRRRPGRIMLGYLLARAGVNVLVPEKHRDFLGDFRSDTIHPSTLQVLDELGLLPP